MVDTCVVMPKLNYHWLSSFSANFCWRFPVYLWSGSVFLFRPAQEIQPCMWQQIHTGHTKTKAKTNMNKYPACLNVRASVMDSAHAEPLASEAWRNICDTFLLTVSLLAAAAPAKQGLSLPQRAHANSRSHSPDYLCIYCIYRCCFVAFSSGFSATAMFSVWM